MVKTSKLIKKLSGVLLFFLFSAVTYAANVTVTSSWGSSLTATVACQGGAGGLSISFDSKGENGNNEYVRVLDKDNNQVWWNGQNICQPGTSSYNVPNLEQSKEYTIEIGRQACHQFCVGSGCPRPICSGNGAPGQNCDKSKDGSPQTATGVIQITCPLTCYNNNGSYADFNSIPIDNFGYFLDDNAQKQTDADQSSGACTCVQNTVWDSNGKCCGDKSSDCGKIALGSICSVGNNTLSTWTSSSSNSGDIRYLKCSNLEYLSDGVSWSSCTGQMWKKSVTSHDYMCIGKGRQTVAECCGDNSCQSKIDGKRLTTGQSIKSGVVQNSTNQTGSNSPTGMVVLNKNKITANVVSTAARVVDDIIWHGSCSTVGPGWEDAGVLFCKHFATFDPMAPNNARVIEDIVMEPSAVNCPLGYENAGGPQEVACKKFAILSSTGTYQLVQDAAFSNVGSCPGALWEGGIGVCKNYQVIFVQIPPKKGTIIANATLNGQAWSGPLTITFNGGTFIINNVPAIKNDTEPGTYTGVVSGQTPGGMALQGVTPFSTQSLGQEGKISFTYNFGSGVSPPPGTGTIKLKATVDGVESASLDGSIILFNWACSSCGPSGQPISQQNTLSLQEIFNAPVGFYNLTYLSGTFSGANFGTITATDADGNSVQGGSVNAELKSGKTLTFSFDFYTGNYNGNKNNETYYCRTDSALVTDLDTPNSQLNSSLNAKNKKTCEKAGFTWTGTKCCSEDDDPHEFYNDPNGTGGCWDKNVVLSLKFVNGTNNSVENYKGVFQGCALDKGNFSYLLNISDKHTNQRLITNQNYCYIDQDKYYYCSFLGQWLPTDGSDKSHLSAAPLDNAEQAQGCCGQSECWSGTNCTANQKSNPLAQPINGYRCIDGNWTKSDLKESMDGSTFGYCPTNSQCLVSVFGNESVSCINSTQYIEDNYCEGGNWTSRTKLLALKLLKMKSADYVLFCDNRENSLNNLQYLTGTGEVVGNVLSNMQTNNFCVLKSGSKVIAGTSINKNLENASKKDFNIFGVTDCNSAFIDDGQYHSCDATGKVWYNKNLKSFIYSSAAINVPAEQETSSFIMVIIQNIIGAIKRLIASPPFDDSYLTSIKRFYRLYMSDQAGKMIKGSIEGKSFRNAVIQYSGFSDDICSFVDSFNKKNNDISSGVSCIKESNNYYVLAQGSQLSNLDPDLIWPDLTSKLRVK